MVTGVPMSTDCAHDKKEGWTGKASNCMAIALLGKVKDDKKYKVERCLRCGYVSVTPCDRETY